MVLFCIGSDSDDDDDEDQPVLDTINVIHDGGVNRIRVSLSKYVIAHLNCIIY